MSLSVGIVLEQPAHADHLDPAAAVEQEVRSVHHLPGLRVDSCRLPPDRVARAPKA